MKRSLLRVSQLAAILTLAALTGCDRNSQAGLLQQPRGTKGKKAVVTPDQEYDEMFITSTSKLSDSTYLIIARAERGSTFVVHTGPRPASDHAVCCSSTNNPGFREYVGEYYRSAGAVGHSKQRDRLVGYAAVSRPPGQRPGLSFGNYRPLTGLPTSTGPSIVMYSKAKTTQLRQAFWTALGQYMAPVPSAEGETTNWINYKTGLKHVYFRMQADNRRATIAIELSHPDEGIRELFFEQFREVQGLLHEALGEPWTWEAHATDAQGLAFSRIYTELGPVNLFSRDDWPALISFFKPRLIALDAFWTDAQYAFEALK